MIEKGDFIKIDFVGRLESGEIFDLTKEDLAKKEKIYNEKVKYGPVPVVIGEKFLLPALEEKLVGLNINDKKQISLEPDTAFGQRKPELVKTVPVKVFQEQKVEPKAGMVVDFGNNQKGRIQSVSGGRVKVDFNHPLAGKKLNYEVEIKEKLEEPKEKIKAVLDYIDIQPLDIAIEEKTTIIKPNPAKAIPPQIKHRVSEILFKHLGMEKVKFVDEFNKPTS